ncbi:Uncharacterized protein HA466_0304940 [Hirschfeldia incana]|nr:Uncharacterized protein HA466_0304940 [Hirschfeldia incana]
MESKAICLGFLPPRLQLSSRLSLSLPRVSSTSPNVRQTLVWRNKPQGGRVLCSSQPDSFAPRAELFRGKSGSVSFNGLTHQLVEESKLVSGPFQEEDKGSFLWVLAPAVLISSLILPQFFLSGAIEATFKNDTVAEVVTSFCFETAFYAGLAIFLSVTDRVQRPYLDFSSKRWGLITGLRGYLMSTFLMMGLKVVVPVFAVYMTWPALGMDALIAVLPFLVGCAVQRGFEAQLERRGSSCWPVVPIVFEAVSGDKSSDFCSEADVYDERCVNDCRDYRARSCVGWFGCDFAVSSCSLSLVAHHFSNAPLSFQTCC